MKISEWIIAVAADVADVSEHVVQLSTRQDTILRVHKSQSEKVD